MTLEVIFLKEGLQTEDGQLIYYRNGVPCHAGAIKIDGKIYYIGSGGKAVKGKHVVHSQMSNGLLKRGTYTFADDYTLVKGSYLSPKNSKRTASPKQRKKEILMVVLALLFVVLIVVLLCFSFMNPPEEIIVTTYHNFLNQI